MANDQILKDIGEHQYLAEDLILKWFNQISLGLKYLNDRKIVHGDVSARNIFITEDDNLKLCDIRMTKYKAKKNSSDEGAYLAPEMIGSSLFNHKSDIWALGVLLYYMCSLHFPFDSENFLNMQHKKPAVYVDIPTHYSQGMRQLIKSMLVVDPDSRPDIDQVLFTQHKISKLLWNVDGRRGLQTIDFSPKKESNIEREVVSIEHKNAF